MSPSRHGLILTLIIAVVSAALVLFFIKVPLVPAEASTQAIPIDGLFVILFSIASVFFAIAFVTLVYSAIVFRARPGDTQDGPPLQGHNWLEALWTVVPLLIVMALAVYGAVVLNDITRASAQELEVKIVAAQWSWRFEYPQYGVASTELRLPVNRPVLVKLNSLDVIHSFWVPEFRVKQDAVPGMETVLRITPNKVGRYTLQCAELCGLLHAYMTTPVAVVDSEEFAQWVQEQKR